MSETVIIEPAEYKVWTTTAQFLPFCPEEEFGDVKRVSYGVINQYKNPKTGKFEYLLAERRNTIAFIDFMRGKCKPDMLEAYLNNMHTKEIQCMKTNEFSWENIWNTMPISRGTFNTKRTLQHAQQCFKKSSVMTIVDKAKPRTFMPWFFPKGAPLFRWCRRQKCVIESPFQCAFREMEEETRIKRDVTYQQRINRGTIVERFLGCDGNYYATVYYLVAWYTTPPFYHRTHKNISPEVRRLKWVRDNELSLYLHDRLPLVYTIRKIAENIHRGEEPCINSEMEGPGCKAQVIEPPVLDEQGDGFLVNTTSSWERPRGSVGGETNGVCVCIPVETG
jgi:ADP-ribose pyrophosphatase YjhB (NUDIX family)